MNLKLTLLLTAAVASVASAVSAVEQANIIVAQQQQQQNENVQQRREQRQQQRQENKQEQKQEQRQEQRRQQAPNNAQNRPQFQGPAADKQTTQPAPKQPPDQGKSNSQNKPAANTPPANQNPQFKPPATNQQTTTPTTQQPKTATEPAAKPAENQAARDTGPKRLDAVKAERKETKEGNRTVIRENTRTIIKENNTTIIRHDDTERYRRLGANVQVQRRGNATETVIVRPGGVRIVERFDERGRLLRRSRFVNGREIVLIDNRYRPGSDVTFIVRLPPPVIRIPRERYIVEYRQAPHAWIYETLIAPPVEPISQRFTLDEIRYNLVVRERMPRIDIDTINFETGSWEVTPDQAQLLGPIAEAMRQAIEKNPEEVYLVEGHTDAVGSEEDNLSLSDRRAEAVAEVLTAQFNIPPENLVTQGYGEQNLKVETQGPEPRNRYVTVRRITPLLAQEASSQAPRQ